MSRTDKDMPIRIQEEDGRGLCYRQYRTGEMIGGMYAHIGRRTRRYWKSVRQHERIALARREEPEPARPRNNEKWWYW